MRIDDESIYRFEKFFMPAAEGCWEWQGARNQKGYGIFQYKGRGIGAHRIAYALTHDELPAHLQVLHTCDNPSCLRPSHLWLGTIADNMKDKAAKGRAASGECNGNHKLKDDQVDLIMSSSLGSRELGKLLGVSQRHINRVRAGKRGVR